MAKLNASPRSPRGQVHSRLKNCLAGPLFPSFPNPWVSGEMQQFASLSDFVGPSHDAQSKYLLRYASSCISVPQPLQPEMVEMM